MKYIIMCGGEYDAFTLPRHLCKINGEPIVERTVRLLRELGIDDISISTNDIEHFKYLNVPILTHNNNYTVANNFNVWRKSDFKGYWVNAFYLLDEPCCYIMGDVWFSREALKQIIDTNTDDILFFGTAAPYAKGYNKTYEEPLAFKVVNQQRFKYCIEESKRMQDAGLTRRIAISWELYRLIDGIDINTHKLGKKFVGIHAFVLDIDKPEEVKELEEAIKVSGCE